MDLLCIYIVEDDPIIGADLADRLEEMGYRPEGPFATGEEAYAAMEITPPDLVVMDVQLAGAWDGIETARRMTERKPLPVIFVTANADDVTFTRAKTTLPAAFLSKPFRGRDLMRAIELALHHSAHHEPVKEKTDTETHHSYLLSDRLFIKVKERMVRVMLADILWVEANDYACTLVAGEKEFFVNQTLGKLSDALADKPEFMRVHRSYVVNLRHVDQIGEIHLYVGKKQIPLSKNLKEELLRRVQKI